MCIHVYIYIKIGIYMSIYVYLKKSFTKYNNCDSKNEVCIANANFVELVFEKSSSNIKELFSKRLSPNLAFAIQTLFYFYWRLLRLEMYVRMYVNIYIYMSIYI